MTNKNLLLFYGGMISLAILVLLFAVRLYQPLLLDIDAKWLVLAGLPILIALFTAGYISKFKGFGMEIEALVQKEIRVDDSILTAVNQTYAKEKQSLPELYAMSVDQKNQYNVLSFKAGQPDDYYAPYAVMEYVRCLPHVKFFQIKDHNDHFWALIKIDRTLFTETDLNYKYVERLIEMISGNEERIGYFNMSREFVYSSASIIETLKKLHSSTKDFIAVLESSENRVLKYIAEERRIEKELANIVIHSIDKN